MTTIHTLASGSSGNAALFSCGGRHILIDAGISCRRITAALKTLGLTPQDLDGVLITHTHTDHIAGLQTLLKRTVFPIYGSGRTCRELDFRLAGISSRLEELPMMEAVSFSGICVTAFPTSHDAPGSCGFRLDGGSGSVGFITDTGYVTPQAKEVLRGVDLVVLESNHDVDAVLSGFYPYHLKKRILGSEGHLCNEDAAAFAAELAQSGTREVILAHLSEENNSPGMAKNAVEQALKRTGREVRLSLAPRHELSAPYRLKEDLCRK